MIISAVFPILFAGSVGSRLCYVCWEPTNSAVNRVCEFILRLPS